MSLKGKMRMHPPTGGKRKIVPRRVTVDGDGDSAPFHIENIGDPYEASRALARAETGREYDLVVQMIVDAVAKGKK